MQLSSIKILITFIATPVKVYYRRGTRLIVVLFPLEETVLNPNRPSATGLYNEAHLAFLFLIYGWPHNWRFDFVANGTRVLGSKRKKRPNLALAVPGAHNTSSRNFQHGEGQLGSPMNTNYGKWVFLKKIIYKRNIPPPLRTHMQETGRKVVARYFFKLKLLTF